MTLCTPDRDESRRGPDENPEPQPAQLPFTEPQQTDLDADDYLFPSIEASRPALPKANAVTKLVESLMRNALPAHVADAVARSVTDPTAVRNRLSAANTVRVPGAVLRTVETTVFAPAVLPYPANPRAAGEWRFPIAGDGTRRPLCEVAAIRGSTVPELLLNADTPEHVSDALSKNAVALRGMNNYHESIAIQGVLRPIIAVPLTITHVDGTKPVTLLTAVDGSSRVTACHDLLGLAPFESLYKLAPDVKRLRREIERHVKIAGDDPTSDQLAALRALEIPATIVVGFEPADPRVDFATAVRSLLGLIHVDPPRSWGAEGSLDTRADSVVSTLVDEGLLDETRARWISGMLAPQEAAAAGLPALPDERFASILLTLLNPNWKRSINRGIQRLSISAMNIPREQRMMITVELGLRAVRHRYNSDHLSEARYALRMALDVQGIVTQFKKDQDRIVDAWQVSRRSPDELLDAALAELRTDSGRSARLELGVLGAWWLITTGMLSRARRNGSDNREPAKILRGLLADEHGLRVLHRAIVDGRADSRIAVVDATGAVERSTTGQIRFLDEERLRALVVTDEDTEGAEVAAIVERVEQTLPPGERLRLGSRRLVALTEQLQAELATIAEIKDHDGKQIVGHYGIESVLVEKMKEHLDRVRDDLTYYGRVWTNFENSHRGKLGEQ